MTRIVYFAAVSLDGRIAGPDDDLAFLDTFEGTFTEGTYNMHAVIAGFDALIMGATTFRVVLERIASGLHPQWPYGRTPAWIVTHAPDLPPVPGESNLHRFAGDVRELVAQVGRSGAERTWLVGGGDLAGRFLAADLVDELILGLAPALIGRGPALADGAFPLRTFRLVDLQQSGSAVALRYERERAAWGSSEQRMLAA